MSPSLQTMGFFMSDINFCNTKEQLTHLGEVVTGKVDGSPTGADIDTSTLPYTGQVRKTLPALEDEYEQSITDKEAEADAVIDTYRLLNKGQYAPGILLSNNFEFVEYNGAAYFATSPPYTTTATTPDADGNLFVGGYINSQQSEDISRQVLSDEISGFTNLTFDSVDDMISGGSKVTWSIGTIGTQCSTGGTSWRQVSFSSPMSISDFYPETEISLDDFESTSEALSYQNVTVVNKLQKGVTDITDTVSIPNRGLFFRGMSYDSAIFNFNPNSLSPAFKFENGDDGSERLLRTGIADVAINGAEISGTATGNNAIWGNNLHFFSMDKVFATRFNVPGEYAFRFTGGDFSSSQFSMLNRISNSIADGCAGGLRFGNTTLGQDGPVNASLIDHNRLTGLNNGAGIGINMRKGFANTFLCNDVELFDTAYSIGDNGNCIVGGDIESNNKAFITEAPNSSIYGESGFTEDYVLDFDVFGGVCTSLTDIWGDDLHFNIDRYKGLIRQRSIDTSSENLILNGDFENGAQGGGRWDVSRLTTDKSIQGDYSLKFTNATDPSGGFVFAPDRFMQNTWYTISCWVNVDDTVTNTPALRMRVGASDTGYKSGLADIDGRALNLTGNAGTAPSNLPSNSLRADGKWRRYVFSFNSESNTDFPNTLEFYTPSGVVGGSFYVDCIKVEEGTVGTMFSRSPLDAMRSIIGNGSNVTLSVFGGDHIGDTTNSAYNVTLPDAGITSAGTKWTITKFKGSSRISIFTASNQKINGAVYDSGVGYDPTFFDALYNSRTFTSDGVDGWVVTSEVVN